MMKKNLLNKILAAAIAYAIPVIVNYFANKFFSKKQKPETKQLQS